MKVIILGDGIVSLALAKTLVNEGIQVDLVNNSNAKSINKNRTLGITKSNIDFFNKKILDISKLSWEINQIEIFLEKFKKKTVLNFDGKKKQLFSIIKNYKLYEILDKSLKKNKLFKKKKLSSTKFINNFNHEIIINCDANSLLTKKFFYKKTKKNYQSIAYVSTIKHKKIIQNNISYQIFTKYGPIAFLPISENETSIVYSVKKDNSLNLDSIENLIKKHNPKYSIIKIEKIENFELISSNLKSYYHKNILAFGDLLHRIHPLAGQGFNMTIRDIQVFYKIIKDKIDLGLEINNSIFVDFEKNLKHKNYIFSSGIDFLYEFFALESNIQDKKLGKIIKFFGKNQSINKFFKKIADKGI